jgi:hypothetical protein
VEFDDRAWLEWGRLLMPVLAKVVDDEHERETALALAEKEAREKEERRKARAAKVDEVLQRANTQKVTEVELEAALQAIEDEYGPDDAVAFLADDEVELVDDQSVSSTVADEEVAASVMASVRCVLDL